MLKCYGVLLNQCKGISSKNSLVIVILHELQNLGILREGDKTYQGKYLTLTE